MRFRAIFLLLLALAGCAPGASDADLADPAAHAPGAARYTLRTLGPEWTTAEGRRLHIHVPGSASAEGGLARRAAAVERARADVLRLLETRDDGDTLEVFFLRSPEEMRTLIGRTPGGFSDPPSKTVFISARMGAHPPLRHELMHVYAERRWGAPREPWLHEGLAVLASGTCAGYPLHALAATLRADGDLVPLRELPTRFTYEGLAGPLQAASVVAYVHETRGLRGVRTLWERGLEDGARALGTSVEAMERAWLARTQREPTTRAVYWDAIRAHGCE